MKASPFLVAQRAKGFPALIRRARGITGRYSLSPAKIDRALEQFTRVLERFNCGASFPITAVALKRNARTIQKYRGKNIEFSVHGYTHVDYSQLTPDEQLCHLNLACEVFADSGIASAGFRSPYLSRAPHLNSLLETTGFSYVSNQPIIWDGLDVQAIAPSHRDEYQRALDFYQPWNSCQRASLPWINHRLVEIPISLPDDEIFVERLHAGTQLMTEVWRYALVQTYQKGELLTLMLHPERISFCSEVLANVLSDASSFTPTIWFARLDEVADWWKARDRTRIEIWDTEDGGYHVSVTGPSGTNLLVHGVETDVPSRTWMDAYRLVDANNFIVYSPFRPFIGLSTNTTPQFAEWLRQQGYISEVSTERSRYICYFDQPSFNLEQERLILDQIEKTDIPLVRLNRWPNGARSALAITGDIDALTLWDYGLRMFGK